MLAKTISTCMQEVRCLVYNAVADTLPGSGPLCGWCINAVCLYIQRYACLQRQYCAESSRLLTPAHHQALGQASSGQQRGPEAHSPSKQARVASAAYPTAYSAPAPAPQAAPVAPVASAASLLWAACSRLPVPWVCLPGIRAAGVPDIQLLSVLRRDAGFNMTAAA